MGADGMSREAPEGAVRDRPALVDEDADAPLEPPKSRRGDHGAAHAHFGADTDGCSTDAPVAPCGIDPDLWPLWPDCPPDRPVAEGVAQDLAQALAKCRRETARRTVAITEADVVDEKLTAVDDGAMLGDFDVDPNDGTTNPVLVGRRADRLVYVIPRIQVLRALRDDVSVSRLEQAEGTGGIVLRVRELAERKLLSVVGDVDVIAVASAYIGRGGNAVAEVLVSEV